MALPFKFAEYAVDESAAVVVLDSNIYTLAEDGVQLLGVLWSDSTPTQPRGSITVSAPVSTTVAGRKDASGQVTLTLTLTTTVSGSEGSSTTIQVTETVTAVFAGSKSVNGAVSASLSAPSAQVSGGKGVSGQIATSLSSPTVTISGTKQLSGEPHSGTITVTATPTTTVAGKKSTSGQVTTTLASPTVTISGTKFIPVLGQGLITVNQPVTTALVGKKAARGPLLLAPGSPAVTITGTATVTKGIFVWHTVTSTFAGTKAATGRVTCTLSASVTIGIPQPAPRVHRPGVRVYRGRSYGVATYNPFTGTASIGSGSGGGAESPF